MRFVFINIVTAALDTFFRTIPRGLCRGEGYGDTVVSFLECADNATLDVAAGILGIPEASLPRNTRFEMSLPIRFGGMGVGGLVTWADAAHVGAVGLVMGSAIRFLTTQDAMLALASRCLASMYKVAIVILVLCVMLLSVLYFLLVAVGRPCRRLRRPPSLSSHFFSRHTRPPCGAGTTYV
jgi:hypothetical protein